MHAQATQRRSPVTWAAASNSTAPWPGSPRLMRIRWKRTIRRFWRPLPAAPCGPHSRTIDERSSSSAENRGPFGRRRSIDVDLAFDNLEIAGDRTVHRALSRDLDQARSLHFVQIALQRDLLNDPLDPLPDHLAIDLFRDDQPLVVGTDRHSIDRPALTPGVEQDRQYRAMPQGRQQEFVGIGSQTVAARLNRFVADERQVSGID